MARALAQGGFDDVLVLGRDDLDSVLTAKRREILSYLKRNDADSVRSLARALDRDKASVSRDLKLLATYDIIDYSTDGSAKSPELKHETVVIEPLV